MIKEINQLKFMENVPYRIKIYRNFISQDVVSRGFIFYNDTADSVVLIWMVNEYYLS